MVLPTMEMRRLDGLLQRFAGLTRGRMLCCASASGASAEQAPVSREAAKVLKPPMAPFEHMLLHVEKGVKLLQVHSWFQSTAALRCVVAAAVPSSSSTPFSDLSQRDNAECSSHSWLAECLPCDAAR